jgi:hypothetical protein
MKKAIMAVLSVLITSTVVYAETGTISASFEDKAGVMGQEAIIACPSITGTPEGKVKFVTAKGEGKEANLVDWDWPTGQVKVTIPEMKSGTEKVTVTVLKDDGITVICESSILVIPSKPDDNQNVTLGAAYVWIVGISEFAPTVMMRILLSPRTYQQQDSTTFNLMADKIPGAKGRIDLNIGRTSDVLTHNPKDDKEKKAYTIVGLSYMVNASAFINFGVVPENGYGYLGITVDYNLLKGLGVVSK